MNAADRRGRFFTSSQYTAEDAAFGDTRGFARLWDGEGAMVETAPEMPGWQRGQIMRTSQPVFVLTSLGPMLDKAGPAGWRPNI